MPDDTPPAASGTGDTGSVGTTTGVTGTTTTTGVTGTTATTGVAGTAAATGTPTSGANDPWYASLPPDLHTDPNVTKYKSTEDLVRGHLSAVSMLGRDKIPMPRTDAEFRDVYKRLGAPETAADYTFEDKDYGVPETLYPKDRQTADQKMFQDWAYDVGLTQKQAAGLYDRFMTFQNTSIGALGKVVDAQMAACDELMDKTWGESRATNLEIASRAVAKLFGEQGADAINTAGLGRNFDFLQGMLNIGLKITEDLGIDRKGNSTRTPDQLRGELAQLQAHPGYFDKSHPEHRLVNAQALEIIKRTAPKQ